VLSFYDWYGTKVFATPRGWLEPILQDRPTLFTPEFLHALREYHEAPTDAQAAIDNLDFDPFLNAQDNAENYEVGSISRKGNTYWVEVYGVWSGKKGRKPDVVPELIFKNGRWFFANFHYPNATSSDHENLLSILRIIRDAREKPRK
jgi:hypothetical protein